MATTHQSNTRTPAKPSNHTTTYKDTYQEVTDAVIKALEEGTVIWQCSWNQAGLPKNITTGIEYRGWNIFWLNFHTMLNGYATPYYLTYKQAQALGGNIRKGEKGTRIVYWATVESKRKDDGSSDSTANNVTNNDTDALQVKPATKLVPKAHTVFNIAQTEGIDFDLPASTSKSKNEQILACEQVIADMPNPPVIQCNGNNAYYIPTTDIVVIPNLTNSITAEGYYSTFFHELAHSTGHATRLNRKELVESDGYGKANYAKEELTAEMTSAFLCAITGIGLPTLANSAAYIQGWLKALRNDKTLILKATAQAQRACDYILNVNYEAS